MIITVTPNPAMDDTYYCHGAVSGETNRVTLAGSRLGGKGVNVSRTLAQEDIQNVAVLRAAADVDTLNAVEPISGVTFHTVRAGERTRHCMSFFDELTGQTTLFNEAGIESTADGCDLLLDGVAEICSPGDVVVGSGSLPPGAPEDFYASLVHMAHRHGATAIVDVGGAPLILAAQAGVDYVKPNRAEILNAFPGMSSVEAARKLLELGAGRVLVSRGEEGMLFVVPGLVFSARLPEPLKGNPTGAGDAAVAALAASVGKYFGVLSTETMLARVVAWSASAVLCRFAGELSPVWRDLEAKVQVERNTPTSNTPERDRKVAS